MCVRSTGDLELAAGASLKSKSGLKPVLTRLHLRSQLGLEEGHQQNMHSLASLCMELQMVHNCLELRQVHPQHICVCV